MTDEELVAAAIRVRRSAVLGLWTARVGYATALVGMFVSLTGLFADRLDWVVGGVVLAAGNTLLIAVNHWHARRVDAKLAQVSAEIERRKAG